MAAIRAIVVPTILLGVIVASGALAFVFRAGSIPPLLLAVLPRLTRSSAGAPPTALSDAAKRASRSIVILECALDIGHPVYDCLYLALARRESAAIVTADARLLAAARKARIKAKTL